MTALSLSLSLKRAGEGTASGGLLSRCTFGRAGALLCYYVADAAAAEDYSSDSRRHSCSQTETVSSLLLARCSLCLSVYSPYFRPLPPHAIALSLLRRNCTALTHTSLIAIASFLLSLPVPPTQCNAMQCTHKYHTLLTVISDGIALAEWSQFISSNFPECKIAFCSFALCCFVFYSREKRFFQGNLIRTVLAANVQWPSRAGRQSR
jgi:hypothetical protein